MNKIYIYEDEGYKNFLPLVYLRPVFDLYCGMFTFRERIQKLYPKAKIYPLSRFDSQTPKLSNSQTLFINGRAILHSPLPDKKGVFVAHDEVVGFRVESSELRVQSFEMPMGAETLNSLKKKLEKIEVEATVIKYPWDLIEENESTIAKDFELLSQSEIAPTRSKKQEARSENIWISESAKIEEGVFLYGGPIYIGDKAHIKPPTIIEGPCFIGNGAIIDGAKIRPGTTIGKVCRIGGEIEASIFSDYSNKHHEGFVGHSFIGEWVNLGALTTTSDLKNTYGTVKVQSEKCKGKSGQIDTGHLKVGSFIGDHTKTGIGILLNTGCVIGCFANIYGGGLMPKYIPSFTWGAKNELTEYNLEKAIEVAKKVMARRKVKLTEDYEQ
ncbi:hypothetical protein KAW50_08400, partial [candidate division WOR-3 bacterium]|nr:hypothetical protein [candidate division WOR-3 bacterium]